MVERSDDDFPRWVYVSVLLLATAIVTLLYWFTETFQQKVGS